MRNLVISASKTDSIVELRSLCGAVMDLTVVEPAAALNAVDGSDFDVILLEIDSSMAAGPLVHSLRMSKVYAPILLIAPSDRLIDVVYALKAGADDYLTIPVDVENVIRRLFELSRESAARARPLLVLGKLRIDINRCTVYADNERLHLTGKEFQILELLATRQGTMVTKGQLLDHLYAGRYEPVMKIIDVFICKLRKKLYAATGDNYIQTIWGRGYVLRSAQIEHDSVRRAMTA